MAVGFINRATEGDVRIIARRDKITPTEVSDIKTITIPDDYLLRSEIGTTISIDSRNIDLSAKSTTTSDIDNIGSNIDDILGDRKEKLVTLESLYYYHKILTRSLSTKLEANICTRCDGLLDENLKCIFCGTQYRLVADK